MARVLAQIDLEQAIGQTLFVEHLEPKGEGRQQFGNEAAHP